MPSAQDKKEFDRMANAPSTVIPVPPFPKVPDEIRKRNPDAYKKHEDDIEQWRRGLNFAGRKNSA